MRQPEEARWKYYHGLAKARGSSLTLAELKDLETTEFLMQIGPLGMVQRVREWREVHQTHGGLPGYMADLDHHPGHGNQVAPHCDVMAEFGSGREADNVRIATPLAHLIAQGFHMADEVNLDCDICPLAMILDQLRLKGMDIEALSGNHDHAHGVYVVVPQLHGTCWRGR